MTSIDNSHVDNVPTFKVLVPLGIASDVDGNYYNYIDGQFRRIKDKRFGFQRIRNSERHETWRSSPTSFAKLNDGLPANETR